MAKKAPDAGLLPRIIGAATLDDVAAAFSGAHPDRPEYTWTATARQSGEAIDVEGLVFADGVEIGDFSRRLYYAKKRASAYHDLLEIALEHRGRRIAFHQYRKAFAFYEAVGIRYIDMSAEADGPAVWASFGFEIEKRHHRDQLLKIARDMGIAMPSPAVAGAPLAPYVAAWTSDEANPREVGISAIYKLTAQSAPIPMYVDLDHDIQRRYLQARGILDVPAVEVTS